MSRDGLPDGPGTDRPGHSAAVLTLWRHARIATCDEQSRVFDRGALLVRDDVIEWVGAESDLSGRRAARSHDRARRALADSGTDRLPHASRVRRPACGGVRAAHGGLELRGDCARRRRHPEHRARDTGGQRGSAGRAESAATAVAARGGRDDGRDQVRLRARVRDRGADAARCTATRGDASGHRVHEPARGARVAAGVRRARG